MSSHYSLGYKNFFAACEICDKIIFKNRSNDVYNLLLLFCDEYLNERKQKHMSQLLEELSLKEGLDRADTFYQHLRKAAFEKGIPLIGTFELTPRCTLDCKMCYVHLNESQMHRQEISTDQWISLIDEACDAGMMYATLTGGECLLYPGFKDVYEHLSSRGILITVLTNGTLLDEEIIAWMAARTPRRVQISVYGSSPIGYEKVTGSASAFLKVDRAIDLIKQAGIPFNLVITLSKQLIDDFEDTYRYCRQKNPYSCDVSTYSFEAREETGRIYESFALSIDEKVEIYKVRLRVDGKSLIPHSYEEGKTEKNEAQNGLDDVRLKGIQCSAGRCQFFIGWDGRMTACNIFDFAEAFPLDDGLYYAWKHINHKACEYKLPAECFDCQFRKSCMICPAPHWLASGEGKINLSICEEARKMALEGVY